MSGPEVVNAQSAPLEGDPKDPPGYQARWSRIGPMLGATMLGATIYELAPGNSNCPYHYEYGNEEWLLVLDGHPTLRTPTGTHELKPGDVVCFPEGPDGAHKVTNTGDSNVRYVILSTMHDPSVALYPDSGKIGVWPPGKLFREADAVDYWVGET